MFEIENSRWPRGSEQILSNHNAVNVENELIRRGDLNPRALDISGNV